MKAFKDKNEEGTGFQFLEDLSTAYWCSQVLFTALELELFGLLEKGHDTVNTLAEAAGCRLLELGRLLRAMERMGLVFCRQEHFYNTRQASCFLVPGTDKYMGDFFLYRQYLRPRWDDLTLNVSIRERETVPELSYAERNYRYVAAMDTLVRQKAPEIACFVKTEGINGTILDIGGGAGSLVRTIHGTSYQGDALVFDIPEVIEAARRLYPEERDWQRIELVGGDFRAYEFHRKFSLVCLGNFLHVYGPDEAEALLLKSISLLDETGVVLIHDYFPDRDGAVPWKGALYDLNMMLNTYNGVCHNSETLIRWIKGAGLKIVAVKDLETDTSVIMARKP